jgi:hypothetical protein
VWCFDLRRSKTAKVLITLIVRENQNDIWSAHLIAGGNVPATGYKYQKHERRD